VSGRDYSRSATSIGSMNVEQGVRARWGRAARAGNAGSGGDCGLRVADQPIDERPCPDATYASSAHQACMITKQKLRPKRA
jgi:hypothetical protein